MTTGRHFTQMYRDLKQKGSEVVSSKDRCIELLNYSMTIPPLDYATSFFSRKLNLDYCKAEWAWYVRGDRFDTSIEKHAKLWKKIRAWDDGFNSNYGQYIFGEQNQFAWVVKALTKDPYSRQASIQLLNMSHMYEGNTDFVCTHGINFQIRDGMLNMTVMMRSNDAIYGTTNDVFCFGQLLLAVWAELRHVYPNLQVGAYTHFVCSLHVYERHFDMLDRLVSLEGCDHYEVEQPLPEGRDLQAIRTGDATQGGDYAKWILDYESK